MNRIAMLILVGCADTGAPLASNDLEGLEKKKPSDADALRDLLEEAEVEPLSAPPVASDELVELGRLLLHDKELSGNRDVSCTTCHLEGAGTDDDLALSIGTGGTGGTGVDRVLGAGRVYTARNAPGLYNLHAEPQLFWDGRLSIDFATGVITTPAPLTANDLAVVAPFGALAAQAMFPVTGRPEMRGNVGENELADQTTNAGVWSALMTRLGAIPEYVTLFEAAYPGTSFSSMTFAHAANAMGAYEATAFYSADSDFDEFLAGDDKALKGDAMEGALLFFGAAGCGECHYGPTLSDGEFHNSALAQFGPGRGDGPSKTDDFGRERVTKLLDNRYQFRTSPLRNIELTAPFGHTGEYRDLESFVAHYLDPVDALNDYDVTVEVDDPAHHLTFLENRAAVGATISPDMLTASFDEDDVEYIVAFLEALTGEAVEDECDLVPATVPSGLPVDLGPCVADDDDDDGDDGDDDDDDDDDDGDDD